MKQVLLLREVYTTEVKPHPIRNSSILPVKTKTTPRDGSTILQKGIKSGQPPGIESSVFALLWNKIRLKSISLFQPCSKSTRLDLRPVRHFYLWNARTTFVLEILVTRILSLHGTRLLLVYCWFGLVWFAPITNKQGSVSGRPFRDF